MKIQVTNCTDTLYWYYKYIGMIFDVIRVEQDGTYWVREPNQYQAKNFILRQDAVQIKEPP